MLKELAAVALLSTSVAWGTAAHAANLVLNGDFELGDMDFTSDYGGYHVTKASNIPSLGFADWNTTTDPSGHDSNVFVGGPPGGDPAGPYPTAWQETLTVVAGANYTFSFSGVDVNSGNRANDAILQATINGTPVASLSTTHDWLSASGIWNAGIGTTTAILRIFDVNNEYIANDFALDDISLNGPAPAVAPIPATLPLFLTALGGLGFAARRRKIKA